jgi:hypothetical protein
MIARWGVRDAYLMLVLAGWMLLAQSDEGVWSVADDRASKRDPRPRGLVRFAG